jgi:hypothetical protein
MNLRHWVATKIAEAYGDGGQMPDPEICYDEAEEIVARVISAVSKQMTNGILPDTTKIWDWETEQ